MENKECVICFEDRNVFCDCHQCKGQICIQCYEKIWKCPFCRIQLNGDDNEQSSNDNTLIEHFNPTFVIEDDYIEHYENMLEYDENDLLNSIDLQELQDYFDNHDIEAGSDISNITPIYYSYNVY